MELVRKQKHYGCVLSGRGLAKWSSGGTPKGQAKVLLCHSGLLLITSDKSEAFFKVVRMRCWRITTLQPVLNCLSKYYELMVILWILSIGRRKKTSMTFKTDICKMKDRIMTTVNLN